jgi:hypothetical protein
MSWAGPDNFPATSLADNLDSKLLLLLAHNPTHVSKPPRLHACIENTNRLLDIHASDGGWSLKQIGSKLGFWFFPISYLEGFEFVIFLKCFPSFYVFFRSKILHPTASRNNFKL